MTQKLEVVQIDVILEWGLNGQISIYCPFSPCTSKDVCGDLRKYGLILCDVLLNDGLKHQYVIIKAQR